MTQTTGSDTRMYNPRSESEEFMYADDKEVFGEGDPEHRDLEAQKKKEEREERERKWAGLHHLKIKTAKPAMEEPFAESTPMEQQGELSDLTGPSGSMGENLDVATGARTGTGSALGEMPPQLPAMGIFGQTKSEPMESAWDDLIIKVLGDPVGTSTLESADRAMRSGIGPGGAKGRKGHRVKPFPRPIGGRSPWAASKRRASVHQRLFGNIKGRGGKSIRSKSKTGMMRQPYALSPHHLGVGVMWGKPRPGRLEDPGSYISWLGRQSAYRGAGGSGVMLPYTPHAPRERLGQLGFPGAQGSGRQRMLPGASQLAREGPRRATRGPPRPKGMGRGIPSPLSPRPMASPLMAKSELEELVEVSKAYVRQLGPGLSHIDMGDFRELLRELKHLLAKLPRKSLMGIAGGGSRSEGQVNAPANGPQKTSRNEGATETDPEDDPRYWGADPSQLTRRGGVHHA
tara:strand:+ start:15858 stop:17231 length:1374 start_codon:yes stop_codon:yes gene_type:complete